MNNEYEVRGEITAIIVNSPKYGRQVAIISTSKLDRVKEFPNSWYVLCREETSTFYVQGAMPRANGKQKAVLLHRWLTNAPKTTDVDHRNHDGLDNTDKNLRISTRSENQQNRKGARSDNKSSGIRGVTWNKRNNKWISKIKVSGKQIYLGYFTDLSDAERAAVEARAKYMPFSKEAAGYSA